MTHDHTEENTEKGEKKEDTRNNAIGANAISLLVLGVEFLLEGNAELGSETLESLEILLILTFVLDLGADTCVKEVSLVRDKM